jgi:hypothetical protein
MNGYAGLKLNLVMAAIHASEARNAGAKPEKIAGSKRSEIRNLNFAIVSTGSRPKLEIRHLRII